MAPFNEAVSVHQSASSEGVYEGEIDSTWNIGSVPCGGYSLALVLEACIQHQGGAPHVDPLHITAHFLKPTTPSTAFSVHIQTLKSGRGFTNLSAEFIQEKSLRITAHAIFGVNGPLSDGSPSMTLKPPSTYARRIPLYSHPSTAEWLPMRSGWSFHGHTQWAYDIETIQRNEPSHLKWKDRESFQVGGGGLEWAAWFRFEKATEKLSNVYIPFLADMFSNTPTLLPKQEQGQQIGVNWYPTMVIAIDFKFPIRELTSDHGQRTVGLYSSGHFINEPQGRHDIYCEVWSAPCDGHYGSPPQEGWREKQICLATATQMALTVPIAVNMKNKKSKL